MQPLIEQRHRAGPAGGAGFDLVREAGDGEAMRGKLFEILQLLHVAVGNLAAGFVAFPDDRRVVGLEPALAGVHERRVPAPGVDAGDAHAARGEIKRGFAAHADAGGEILVAADALGRARVDQHDVERFELVADALELGLDLRRRHHMAVRHFAKVELDAGPEEPVERHLVDGHHRRTVDRVRLEVDRRVHMRAVMRRQLDVLDRPAFAVRQILAAKAGKQLAQQRRGIGVALVLDLRPHEGRVVHRLVFERRRQIDHAAGQFHKSSLGCSRLWLGALGRVLRIEAKLLALRQDLALHRILRGGAVEILGQVERLYAERINREVIVMHDIVVPRRAGAVIAVILPLHGVVRRRHLGVIVQPFHADAGRRRLAVHDARVRIGAFLDRRDVAPECRPAPNERSRGA